MTFLAWTPDMSVGNEAIDMEHKQWIEFLDQLHNAVENESDLSTICTLVARIHSYTELHFKNEEMLFDQTAYPDKEAHKQEHAAFLKEIEPFSNACVRTNMLRLQGRINEAEITDANEEFLMGFLGSMKDWLMQHVEKTDMKYVPYLKSA